MRTTLNINDDLLKQAARLSGITEKTAVVHTGLEALVARESAKRLAAMGSSEPRVRKIRRRRPRPERRIYSTTIARIPHWKGERYPVNLGKTSN